MLVTGGGGFLGAAIVKRLVERGDQVTSFSRTHHPKLDSWNVRQIQGDIRDKEAVNRACKGTDIVFHAAAKAGIWGPYREYHSINVTGTENIINACLTANRSSLIHTSSPSVVFDGTDMEGVDESVPYPDSYTAHYPKTKALAERSVVNASRMGLQTIILRPHLIWGPEDTSLVPRIIQRAHQLSIVGHGRNRVDTVYIDNAAEAHTLAADRLEKNPQLSGKIYFISQGAPIPLWDMVNSILEAADLPPVRRSVPKTVARILGTILEGVHGTLRIRKEPRMTRFLAEELATAHWFDISAAKRELGYHPRVTTAEGLHRLKNWLESNGERRFYPAG